MIGKLEIKEDGHRHAFNLFHFIPEKSNKKKRNYRSISLINIDVKTVNRILANKIRNVSGPLIHND